MPDLRDAVGWAKLLEAGFELHLPHDARYQPPALPAADWVGEILRPGDLLHLVVHAYNLRPQTHPSGPRLARLNPDAVSLLAFELPPQAIGEQAYYEPSPVRQAPAPGQPEQDDLSQPADTLPPHGVAKARIAGPSRLVFRVDRAWLPLTVEGLLDWDALQPVLAPLAALPRTPDATQMDGAPAIAPPEPLHTAIELPYRLLLSPNGDACWTHSREPVSHGGRTELWHTRVALRDAQGGVREAGPGATVPLRAIWSPDHVPGGAPDKKADDPDLGTAAMNPNDRHQIVALTSDYANFRRWRVPPIAPAPVEAEQLMLSALGGWLRSRGHWDLPQPGPHDPHRIQPFTPGRELRLPVARAIPYAPGLKDVLDMDGIFARGPVDDLDMTEWVHVAAQGRDHYVRIVYDGCLFPLGHRASLVKVTERRFEDNGPGPVALLRQYAYVVVREPVRTYPRGAYPGDGREMPFTRIEIRTRVTPHLFKPTDAPAAIDGANYAFWIMDSLTARDVPFAVAGFDADGRAVPFAMPLIFVRRGPERMDLVRDEWRRAPRLAGRPLRRRAAVDGFPLRFAPGGDDNAVLPVRALYFDVAGDGACGGFMPVIAKADVTLSGVEQLVGGGAGTTIAFDPGYLANGLDDAVGLFARIQKDAGADLADGALGLMFAAEQAGGIATPNANLTGLTSLQGPIAGNLAEAVLDRFDPKAFFGGLAAGREPLLFGAFSLADILHTGTSMANAPKIVKAIESGTAVTRYTWQTAPKDWTAPGGVAAFDPDDNARLAIEARVETALTGAPPKASMRGELTAFRIALFDGAVAVRFAAFRFASVAGQKMDVAVSLDPDHPIIFDGDLDFVRQLADLIPPGVFGDGPSLDLRPDRIALAFDIGLPPLSVGVFALKNLGLNAGLQLPFADGRPVLDFGFSRREKPFLLTVSLLGGGGFFHLQLDTTGIRIVEAALEFGAAVELDIGVASGNVHILAGIYFKLEIRDSKDQVVLSGYLRMGGALSVLGLITVCVEFNLSFTYDSVKTKVTGRATLMVSVEVAFFSKSVELTVERSFGRDGGDPSFGDLIHTPDVWGEYADAFA
ncbi:hypothetical protein [Bordetella genomosp. 9]|uniref:Uncharacterized protein n=1 Tax=Bordetella genomosp. 9 TaxID=1416803 RepID=A0A1W6YWB7_9BORD|nr:hypothetical protein [Bordetella genomosp. 9]ARP85291.1 hypothetical protein CAL13_02965 [Bordetella genomosp. 9]